MPCTLTRFCAFSVLTWILLCAALPRSGHAQCLVAEDQILTAANVAQDDVFGATVSVSGSVALLGAPFRDGPAADTGAAYVFRRSGSQWVEGPMLTDSAPASDDNFGWSVAIDGNVAVVGAPEDGGGSGQVWIFRYDGVQWNEEQVLSGTKAGGEFGEVVAVSGNVVVVGEPAGDGAAVGSGIAHVYTFDGAQWNGQAIQAGNGALDDRFGAFVSISGPVVVVGANESNFSGNESGAAYVFRFNGSQWLEEQQLVPSNAKANDDIGVNSVSGDVIVLAAVEDDLSGPGSDEGSVYVFRHDGASWVEEQQILAVDGVPEHFFGHAVTVSGNLLAVATVDDADLGTEAGAVYVYRFDGTRWVQVFKLLASNGAPFDSLGNTISLSGKSLLAGAPFASNGVNESGAAYAKTIPDLALDASRNVAQTGDLLTFTTCGGVQGSLAGLVVVDINGSPLFLNLAFGTFDAQGEWAFGGTVPGGLSGLVVEFLALGIYQPGKVGLSNRETITFQ